MGLFNKYHVTKTDGSPVDPQALYFVLRMDTDPVAALAVLEYARNTPDKSLADDLKNAVWYVGKCYSCARAICRHDRTRNMGAVKICIEWEKAQDLCLYCMGLGRVANLGNSKCLECDGTGRRTV